MMGGGLSSAVRMLLAWNLIVFLLQFIFRGQLEPTFGLVPRDVLHGQFWQIATYMFLHDTHGLGHILVNMFALWMFGSQMEFLWGTQRFLKYYFFTGIGAGVTSLVTTILWPRSPIAMDVPTIGASGAVFGLLLAFGLSFPNRPIMLYFLLPIPAKYFVMIFGAIEVLMSFSRTNSGVAHFAHLGGLLFGWIYLRGLPGLGLFQKAKRHRQKQKFRVLEFRDPDKKDDDRWGQS